MVTLANIVKALFSFYEGIIVVWCILSWFPIGSGTGIIADIREVLDRLVRPFMGIFQRVIPPFGGIDFSPVVAIFVLGVLEQLIVSIIL
ncbi:MAG: YggT family protein [Atopobiaceae bacterium]|jgi:uncharacterized protein YggT (Ycf19 family)|nr:YggT family protein [Atopobiaceae bacterium]MCI2173374.1 YggT family protein [Atopobiaceae bacterium]MCI2207369.1 YggT family protein [Atopobiaceae bacterium]